MNSSGQHIRAQQPAKVWLSALLIQLIAWLFVFAVAYVTLHFKFMTTWSFLQMAVFQGVLASFISRRLKQPIWWFLIQLCFSPLLIFFWAFDVSPWVYLAVFAALALMFWSTFKTRVPFFLTNQQTKAHIAELIGQYQPAQFLDLGCASGALLRDLAIQFPSIECIGYEIAPLPYVVAKWRTRKQRNVHVCYGDFWDLDFNSYDLIYAFLSDEPMNQLWQKVSSEMRSGSVFISNTFTVPDITPDRKVDIEDFRGTQLLIWEMQHQYHAEALDRQLSNNDQNEAAESV